MHIEVAGIMPAMAPVEQLVLTLTGEDAETRLSAFAKTFSEITFANEAQMRVALKDYLDTWLGARDRTPAPPVREGRRMRWLASAAATANGIIVAFTP